ncbi:antibiotic biosynthesis monooxygenase [Streptomyces sp. NPDC058000]|uniref:antibiotic biosynthesis monooxygenase n=1 Tax=Streptomyces sp. NPDC058000 TaxID=3346299 RepID=UPI0036E21898
MPGFAHDRHGALTVVNRFSVKGNTDRFERCFRGHAEFLGARAGFVASTLVRHTGNPRSYVHLNSWADDDAFVKVTRNEEFLDQVRRLGALVETRGDKMAAVLRRGVGRTAGGAGRGVVVLVDYEVDDPEEFEQRLAVRADALTGVEGIRAVELLRSTVSPERYLEAIWWTDREVARTAMDGATYLAHEPWLPGLAGVRTTETRLVSTVLAPGSRESGGGAG